MQFTSDVDFFFFGYSSAWQGFIDWLFILTVPYSNNMVSIFFHMTKAVSTQSALKSDSSVVRKCFPSVDFIGDMILKWISKMIDVFAVFFH